MRFASEGFKPPKMTEASEKWKKHENQNEKKNENQNEKKEK